EQQRELTTLEAEAEGLRPVVEAKRLKAWWRGAWWRAAFRRSLLTRWTELEGRREQLQGDLEALRQKGESLTAERDQAEQAYQAERARLIEAEASRRRAELADQEAALRQEQSLLLAKWQKQCQGLADGNAPPAAMTRTATAEAVAAWQRHLDQAE